MAGDLLRVKKMEHTEMRVPSRSYGKRIEKSIKT